jgi:hypothetical protein
LGILLCCEIVLELRQRLLIIIIPHEMQSPTASRRKQ